VSERNLLLLTADSYMTNFSSPIVVALPLSLKSFFFFYNYLLNFQLHMTKILLHVLHNIMISTQYKKTFNGIS